MDGLNSVLQLLKVLTEYFVKEMEFASEVSIPFIGSGKIDRTVDYVVSKTLIGHDTCNHMVFYGTIFRLTGLLNVAGVVLTICALRT